MIEGDVLTGVEVSDEFAGNNSVNIFLFNLQRLLNINVKALSKLFVKASLAEQVHPIPRASVAGALPGWCVIFNFSKEAVAFVSSGPFKGVNKKFPTK